MNAFVLDVSVAVAWAYGDRATPTSDCALELLLDGGTAYTPSLWRYELANALAVHERRGKRTAENTAAFVEMLDGLAMEEVDARSIDSLLSVSRFHGLSSYDASYLSLAQRLDIPLATNDQDLRAAATRGHVDLI